MAVILTKNLQKDLVEATVQVVDKHLSNYNLFVKKHPRETDSALG